MIIDGRDNENFHNQSDALTSVFTFNETEVTRSFRRLYMGIQKHSWIQLMC